LSHHRCRCPTSTATSRGGRLLLSGGGARRPATPLRRWHARRPATPLRRRRAEVGHTSPAPAREEAGSSGTPAFPDSTGSGRIQRGAARPGRRGRSLDRELHRRDLTRLPAGSRRIRRDAQGAATGGLIRRDRGGANDMWANEHGRWGVEGDPGPAYGILWTPCAPPQRGVCGLEGSDDVESR
jgi:hypothetical protein